MGSFRSLLLDIAQNLRQEDLSSLLFLCSSGFKGFTIPRGTAENIKKTEDFLGEMERQNKLSEDNKGFLAELLDEIKRNDLVKKLTTENTIPDISSLSLSSPSDPDSDDVYNMKSSPRGLMVIVNIVNFKTKKSNLEQRKGSEKNVDELVDLFGRYLDFRVLVRQDKAKEELLEELSDIADDPDNASYDCLAVCIMTHGKGDFFYAADGRLVQFDEVYAMFTNTQCEAFDQKPKLFFIQACRGNKGIEPSNDSPIDGSETTSQAQQNAAERNDPDMSDILIAHSSYEGYVSHRNHKTGSIFIQSLVRVFRQYADKEHIGDLLTRVNLKVYNTVHAVEGRPQVSSPTSTLKKKLYFWPGVKFDH